ncbi:MAG: DJ-1 family protein [Cellvibrionaceae bacterium]|nr:DJ-1 family protein [Cellvibrionaceae bacterium]|tara:strand:- start:18518 stop:19144 length:627 start_codon:yes stop_codon:yes gene_type:complete
MKRVMMLLANGVEPLEMAAFTDVLGWANLVGDEAIELLDVGLRQQIKTTFGLSLCPNYLLPDIDLNEFDALAIPGGFEPSGFYDEALSEPFLNAIRHFAAQDQCIASVCVSSLCLGEAGILEKRNATIYHQVGGRRRKQLEDTGALFVDRPIVVDGQMITSTGPGTAIEVAFELLTKLTSKENADQVKARMRMPTPMPQWFHTAQVPQ